MRLLKFLVRKNFMWYYFFSHLGIILQIGNPDIDLGQYRYKPQQYDEIGHKIVKIVYNLGKAAI